MSVTVTMGVRVGSLFKLSLDNRAFGALLTVGAQAAQRQMLPVDLEVVVLPNGLGKQHDGLIVELFHAAADAAAEVPMAVLGIVERVMDLIMAGVHSIDEPNFVQPFQGSVNRGQIQAGQRGAGFDKKIFGGQVLMPLDLAQQLEQGGPLRGDAQAVGAEKLEIISHEDHRSSRVQGFPPSPCGWR